ncbi:MAG: hypothetical protein ACOC80_09590 [Petrotogales bacterium]
MKERLIEIMVGIGFTRKSAERYIEKTPEHILDQISGDIGEVIFVSNLLKLMALHLKESVEGESNANL